MAIHISEGFCSAPTCQKAVMGHLFIEHLLGASRWEHDGEQVQGVLLSQASSLVGEEGEC